MIDSIKREGRFLLMALVILFAFNAIENSKIASLKNGINTAVHTACMANTSAPILQKYNAIVNTLVNQQLTAEQLNLKEKNAEKAAADAAYAAEFKDGLIQVSTPDCSSPFLP